MRVTKNEVWYPTSEYPSSKNDAWYPFSWDSTLHKMQFLYHSLEGQLSNRWKICWPNTAVHTLLKAIRTFYEKCNVRRNVLREESISIQRGVYFILFWVIEDCPSWKGGRMLLKRTLLTTRSALYFTPSNRGLFLLKGGCTHMNSSIMISSESVGAVRRGCTHMNSNIMISSESVGAVPRTLYLRRRLRS